MIGSLTAGKKAAELGYKVYGVPGAAVAGAGGAVGMVVAKKGLKTVVETDAGAEMETIADEGTEIEVIEENPDETEDSDDPAPARR